MQQHFCHITAVVVHIESEPGRSDRCRLQPISRDTDLGQQRGGWVCRLDRGGGRRVAADLHTGTSTACSAIPVLQCKSASRRMCKGEASFGRAVCPRLYVNSTMCQQQHVSHAWPMHAASRSYRLLQHASIWRQYVLKQRKLCNF